MCGRFAVDDETNAFLEDLVREHGSKALEHWRDYITPNYNVAPTDPVAVVRQRDGERFPERVRWGMVSPSAPQFGDNGRRPVTNARIETVHTNGLFKAAFESRRCVVPALGYYEWQKREDGRQPFFIREGGAQLALAGIVNYWRDKAKSADDSDAWRSSMSIITLDAHVAPGEVHDRMPAFLMPDAIDDWLGDHLDTDDQLRMLTDSSRAVADGIEYYEVSRAVNASGKNAQRGRELIDPV
jgi:putative SOS response-associated peptidase YedK